MKNPGALYFQRFRAKMGMETVGVEPIRPRPLYNMLCFRSHSELYFAVVKMGAKLGAKCCFMHQLYIIYSDYALF